MLGLLGEGAGGALLVLEALMGMSFGYPLSSPPYRVLFTSFYRILINLFIKLPLFKSLCGF